MAVNADRRMERPWPAKTTEVSYRDTAPEPHLTGVNDLSSLSDSDLLFLVSRRDVHALAAIYDRHIEAAWRVALVFSKNVAAAEEAVSEAFLRLWRKPETRSRASLSARLPSSVRREASRA